MLAKYSNVDCCRRDTRRADIVVVAVAVVVARDAAAARVAVQPAAAIKPRLYARQWCPPFIYLLSHLLGTTLANIHKMTTSDAKKKHTRQTDLLYSCLRELEL